MAETQEYEILERIDFGVKRDKDGIILPDEKQAEVRGAYEPTPVGQENPTVSLSQEEAAPLLEAGALKVAGEELPLGTNHDNPEEFGYEGQAEREAGEEPPENPPDASGAAKARAQELGVDLNDVTPTGAGGQITKADVDRAAS